MLLAFLSACVCSSALAGALQPVSAIDPSLRSPAGGGGDSYSPIITPDGRFVLFASTANNLALDASNAPNVALVPARLNVFLRDRVNGTTTLVSANLPGTGGGNGDSIPIELSTNCLYALFESTASDLVPGDTNSTTDLFVRDLAHGTTLLVSVSTNGGAANGPSSGSAMTPDGRFVAFSSAASNLVPGDTNSIPDIFVRDLQLARTILASPGAIRIPGSAASSLAGSDSPLITPDGRYVAFLSMATNLVLGVETSGEIYVRDVVADETFAVSTNARTLFPTGSSVISYSHAISDDGRFVAFEANSSSSAGLGFIFRYNLQTMVTDTVFSNGIPAVGGYRNFRSLEMTPEGRFIAFVGRPGTAVQSTNIWVYLWDGQNDSTTVTSTDPSGAPPTNGVCDWPTLDASGRFVAFLSTATNLSTNRTSGSFQLYVRDLQQAVTTLVSAGPDGAPSAMDFLNGPRLSPDGRFVAFDSTDADLVTDDSNNAYDVFVYDAVSGTNDLISARQAVLPGSTASGASSGPVVSVSDNGRYIAFPASAANLVRDYANLCRGIFVHDLVTGTNLLVSVDTNGLAGADGISAEPSISGDGRYVAFTSRADNLVPGDSNNAQDVLLRDLQSGSTILVSRNMTATGPGNGASYSPKVSADGRYVLFRSLASNLAAGSVSSSENLLWRDVQAGTTSRVPTAGVSGCSLTPDGRFVAYGGLTSGMYIWDSRTATTPFMTATPVLRAVAISPDGNRVAGLADSRVYVADRSVPTNWVLVASGPAGVIPHAALQFSGDGRFLVYTTRTALVAGDTNSAPDIYVYDFLTASNALISQSSLWPGAAKGASDSPAISADGRYVAYRSAASDIVPNDTNGLPDVFLYDLQTTTTTLLSASVRGEFAGNSRSWAPLFSPDGQTVVFQSWASDLELYDFNQNGDLFAMRLSASNSAPVFACQIYFAPGPGQVPTVIWPATLGAAYQVQFKNDLRDPVWQILSGSMTLIGTHAYATDFNPNPGRRFYRVQAP